MVSYKTGYEREFRFGWACANNIKWREPILDDSAGHIRSRARPNSDTSAPLLVAMFGYLLATWRKTAQRANAGNPLTLLVSALGLEPRTL